MWSMKVPAAIIRTTILPGFLIACVSASASVTEIRKDFFQQKGNLTATAIMSGPELDANYLITAYESTNSCVVLPTLRWIDENGNAQSATGTVGAGSGNCYISLIATIRVGAGTVPTMETNGDGTGDLYSLYVCGLGFWPDGSEGQGGLAEKVGSSSALAFTATSSTSALLVAHNSGYVGEDIPYITWTDEYSTHLMKIPVGAAIAMPIRAAAGTRVWVKTYPGDATWYGLVLMGIPAPGPGPFGDYELNFVGWVNASYPNWRTVFTSGDSPVEVLTTTNFAERPNNGPVEEALDITGFSGLDDPCIAGQLADTAGDPASCVVPFAVQANTALQVRTANQTGSPWGLSPTYSAEIDVLRF